MCGNLCKPFVIYAVSGSVFLTISYNDWTLHQHPEQLFCGFCQIKAFASKTGENNYKNNVLNSQQSH